VFIRVNALASAPQVPLVRNVTAPEPRPDDLAAVLFTSGATGPAKGVRYTHRQLYAQRDALQQTYDITPQDSFVAAFAPFALYGPALGIATGLADMDVMSPSTLTASALDDACKRINATMVFASPAALANVVTSATGNLVHLRKVRLVMSAGAPVPIKTLQSVSVLCPDAQLHTPYGMTEMLPVADVSLVELERIGAGRGVCVGQPVTGCDARIDPATREILVAGAWMSAGYDSLWFTQYSARPMVALDGHVTKWHRTGDIGHLDDDGNLWIEGRAVHIIHSHDGAVAPVPLEIAVETLPTVMRAAAVGVGPLGVQQVIIVVETIDHVSGAANVQLTHDVREVLFPQAVAAVWTTKHLPVDIRHNSKIDRTAVSLEMSNILSGRKK
jgi:acyl-coenzyme A synthetase/AMP-(fatty) acid ligase